VYAGWMEVRLVLPTTKTKRLPVSARRMLVQMAKDLGGMYPREIASSHSPDVEQAEGNC